MFAYGYDPVDTESGMYQVGSILGLIHGLLLGFASGGCAGGWALTAARWYERASTAWGMTQAVYNYYNGTASWWDALAFLPAAGWGMRKIGNGLGIFRACFVGDTLVLIRPMPEGTTQAIATAGAGSGDPKHWAAIGAGGFCIIVAAGMVVADARRRRKSREQQRREAIDGIFAREDGFDDLDNPQHDWPEPWMDEIPDSATVDMNELCDQLFNAEETEPWPVSENALWPVSDRATRPTAGLLSRASRPTPRHQTLGKRESEPTALAAGLAAPVSVDDASDASAYGSRSQTVPRAKPKRAARPRSSATKQPTATRSKPQNQRTGSKLRWLALAALALFGTLLLSWGLSPADPPASSLTAVSTTASSVQPKYETRVIRDIRRGDEVLARDELGNAVGWGKVTNTFTRTSDHLRLLTFQYNRGQLQTIRTTNEHPFWIVNKAAFVEAGRLSVGDHVTGPNGEIQTLISTEFQHHPDGVAVHNLEVEGFHTYFVQDAPVTSQPILVHNKCVIGLGFERNLGRLEDEFGAITYHDWMRKLQTFDPDNADEFAFAFRQATNQADEIVFSLQDFNVARAWQEGRVLGGGQGRKTSWEFMQIVTDRELRKKVRFVSDTGEIRLFDVLLEQGFFQ